MIVELLYNLKVSPNEVYDRGHVFEGNRDTFPDWLQIEIERKKNVKIVSDIIAPIPVELKKSNPELKTIAKEAVKEAVKEAKALKPKSRIIKRKI